MEGAIDRLTTLLGPARVISGPAVSEDDWHDESLTAHWHAPDVVVLPHSATEVADIIRIARESRTPVTARGSGTGLAGACVPREGGILIAFREMESIIEIDVDNQVAVVQPGVTLRQLDEATADARARLPGLPRRGQRQPRRQRRHQRGRYARGQVRRDAAPGPRARGGPRDRRGHPHRRQVRQVDLRLRPDTADRRLRGHARGGDRGDPPTAIHGTSTRLPCLRRSHGRGYRDGGAEDRAERARAAHPRVHRHDDDDRDHRRARTRARHRSGGQGRRARVPRRRPRVARPGPPR